MIPLPLWLTSWGPFKWLKDKFFLFLIVAAGCFMIYIGVKAIFAKAGELAIAQQEIALQASAISDLKKEVQNVKDSNKATLESLQSLQASVAKIDLDAKERNTTLAGKIKEIANNSALTPAQKDQETTRLYAENLRATYCAYVPDKCKEKKP